MRGLKPEVYAKKALLIGCGDLGLETARQLHAEGFEIHAARRSIDQLPDHIDGNALKKIKLDVTDLKSLKVIAPINWDIVVITLTARGEEAYWQTYVEGISNLLETLKQSQDKACLILFASSTSVYSQNNGEWVDEQSVVEPAGYSGRTMLEAERLLRESEFVTSCVRFSGIYGNKRGGHLLQVLQSGRICPKQPVRYSNRIHLIDCAAVFVHLVKQYKENQTLRPVYLGCDGNAPTLREVMEWLANQHNIDLDTLIEDYKPDRGGNKRCKSCYLEQEGFEYKYKNYKEGYKH